MTPRQQTLQVESPHLVDLFAGPGGLDVAARWLGVSAVGIEKDKEACATRTEADLATYKGDVREYGPAAFPDARILAGGPPCQTYTVAGTGAGRRVLEQVRTFVKRMAAGDDVRSDLTVLQDERTGLVLEPLRWTMEAIARGKPYEAIVLEQVPQVLPVWEAMREALEAIKYKVVCGILHTEEYGVPQTRRRAILIAHRNHRPQLPAPTHRRYRKGVDRAEGDQRLLPWETMGGALRRSDEFIVVSNYGTGGDPKLRGRRRWDEPAATVTGKVSRNRLVTPDGRELDRFGKQEAGRLQTFPIDYPWRGKDIPQQIGNAIPPRLAAHVLAAALDLTIDGAALDAAVRGRWHEFDDAQPITVAAPRRSRNGASARSSSNRGSNASTEDFTLELLSSGP